MKITTRKILIISLGAFMVSLIVSAATTVVCAEVQAQQLQPQWYSSMVGEAAEDYFGHSVSGAGDVNGDSYDDVIVGADWNDAGGTEAGRAYIFFGGGLMDSLPDVIFTGEAADDYFGYSVSGAGDMNGDGYDDVIVGAPANDARGKGAGRAYLFYGGESMDSLPDVIFTGRQRFYSFGDSVSGAGDMNGDGYDDVIVGADGYDYHKGQAYLFYGGESMDSLPDVIFTGEVDGDRFGDSVSGAGDVNGDSYDDVIVGAPYNDAGGKDAGRAYLFYGGESMDSLPDVTFTGEVDGGNLGASVSGAGDVNDDGYDDMIVGVPWRVKAHIYFGGGLMDSTPDVILTGETEYDHFGSSVNGAGDVNGDGYDDLVIGAPHNNAGGDYSGKAYIYTAKKVQPRTSVDLRVIGGAISAAALIGLIIVIKRRRRVY